MYETYFGKIMIVLNHRHVKYFDKFDMNPTDQIFKNSKAIMQAMNWDDKQLML